MPRTEYNEIDANSQYEEYSVAKRKLTQDLKDDAYTGGMVSTKAASEAISIDETVRKKR